MFITELNEFLAFLYGLILLFTYFSLLDGRNGYMCTCAGDKLMKLMKQLLMIFLS